MKKISIGNTVINGPIIGLGLAALGRPGYINLGHAEDLEQNYEEKSMEQRTHDMLDLAYQNGIRYFDAARSYGKAESFLLSWLQQTSMDTSSVIIGSKWGYYYTADWQIQAEKHEVKEHSLERLNQQWPISRQLLPQLKLYQVHSATFESGILENVAVLKRLAQLKEKGILIGLSTSGPKQAQVLGAAMEITIDGQRLFDSIQITYNLLEQHPGTQLTAAAQEGMLVIVKEGLANGRLTIRNDSPAFAQKKMVLNKIAQQHNVEIDAIALAYILAKPWVDIVLSGAAVPEHLLSNLQGLSVQLSGDHMDELSSIKVESKAYWMERSVMGWN